MLAMFLRRVLLLLKMNTFAAFAQQEAASFKVNETNESVSGSDKIYQGYLINSQKGVYEIEKQMRKR